MDKTLLYTCKFKDGRYPTINGKIHSFETKEKAIHEAKRWGAIEIITCKQNDNGEWIEHESQPVA